MIMVVLIQEIKNNMSNITEMVKHVSKCREDVFQRYNFPKIFAVERLL